LEQAPVIERNIESKRQGDRVAVAVGIIAAHGHFIRNVIRLRVVDVSRREDLFQELVLKVIVQPVPADVQNVRGYLYRAIVHDIADLAREREDNRHHLKNYAETTRISIHKRPSPNAIIEETEERASVLAYLTSRLQPREARVVTLRYWDNYSIVEIAAETGINRRSVSRYLTSGIREIRRMLAID
jgi:RNA polymerase sigma factor (sigma-70 family)